MWAHGCGAGAACAADARWCPRTRRRATACGSEQWADLGIYLQSLMLLAVQHGLATCAQGFWRRYAGTLQQQLGLPEPYRVAFGVALGYEDAAAPINTLRSSRAPWGEWGEMRGF
ncbi:nitroreductase family protein [Pseudomonas aeruginosa]|uniref:nitroreductase family protein n=1 Tax=Pseudomonas aeruginosa TaxID=287 RepID=UPI001910794D|nr:nitroreductase family protein [Pseudomonas aeruginosa]